MNPSRKYSVSVRDVASDCGYLEVISGANPNERIIANALSDEDRYWEVLVLYLERPAQKREFALPHTGRF